MPERSESSATVERPPDLAGPSGPSALSAGTPGESAHVPGDPGRRPYQQPRILFREPLEAMASVCAPHPPAKGNPGVCPSGPISS
jgi:hypothetical protein